jgi:opacity protein-like surface antigen
MANGYLRMPVTRKLSFWGGIGAGWVFADYALDPSIVASLDRNAMKVKTTTKDGYGIKPLGGFEYRLNRNVSLGLTASYLFFETNVTQTDEWQDKYYHETSQTHRVAFDTTEVMASIKYSWK